MSLGRKRKGGCFVSHLLVFALMLAVQMSWQVGCSEMSGIDSLFPEEKHLLYELLTRKRYSFLELFLLGGKEKGDVEVGVDEGGECVASEMYSKMVTVVIGEHSLDLYSERRAAEKCLGLGLERVLGHYKQFLNAKFVDKQTCLEKICSRGPEKLYLKGLESLALSIYSILALSEMIKDGDKVGLPYGKDLALPSELEHKSETISMIGDCERLDSYREGFRVCARFGMVKILIYPKSDKTRLLSDYKVFSSIVQILRVKIEKHASAYRRYKRRWSLFGERKYEKKMTLVSEKVLSLMKLLSYTTLTKLLVLADITNMESYEQVCKSELSSRGHPSQ